MKQRQTGLNIVFEISHQHIVKETPFSERVLDLLQKSKIMMMKEITFMHDFVVSDSRVDQQTIAAFLVEEEKLKAFEIPGIQPSKKLRNDNINSAIFKIDNQEPLKEEILQAQYHNSTIIESSRKEKELRTLAKKCTIHELDDHEQEKIIHAINEDKTLISQLGITPHHLPNLLQYNSKIAQTIFLVLNNEKEIYNFYEALMKCQFSFSSFELVNFLSTHVELPLEYLEIFISKCFDACNAQNDKMKSQRLVRIICMFIYKLIKQNTNSYGCILSKSIILNKAETFCLKYNEVKEALYLQKKIKFINQKN